MSEVERLSSPAFEDPLSPDVAQLLQLLTKAARGMRVYAANNEMLRRFIDEAFAAAQAVLEKTTELTLSVREDRFLLGRDAVHVNADREDGLPFVFYRNAFRRITLLKGLGREELTSLLAAITADYSGYDAAGEDLVTALWRLALPHLRYLTIDAMTMDPKSVGDGAQRTDLERIQVDIEDIVARIYQTEAPEHEIVAGVSITRDDLEALKDIRQEKAEDLDMLDVATARGIADIERADLDRLNQTATRAKDALSTRLIDILIEILFKEQAAREFAATMELILQLFDSLIIAQHYRQAIHLIGRLRQRPTENLKEVHIGQHLFKSFAAESRVIPVVHSMNDERKTSSVLEVVDFLRALGPAIVPSLIDGLEILNSPAHRRLLTELILDLGPPSPRVLLERMRIAKWFVARDLLTVAQRHPLEHITHLVQLALNHEHPKLREHAVALLRGYARGQADRLVAERILDPDPEVRVAAIRVAAARRSVEAKPVIEALLEKEELFERDPRELRLLMAAYASIAGWEAIGALDRVLNPGFFARSKHTDAQIAAAHALGSIGTAGAQAALHKGSRTINGKVREACKRALSREPGGQGELAADIPRASTPVGELPREGISPESSVVPPELRRDHEPAATRTPREDDPSSGRFGRIDDPASGRFTAELLSRAARPGISESAPDFALGALPPEGEERTLVGVRPPPGVGRVLAVQPSKDEIPQRLIEVHVGSPLTPPPDLTPAPSSAPAAGARAPAPNAPGPAVPPPAHPLPAVSGGRPLATAPAPWPPTGRTIPPAPTPAPFTARPTPAPGTAAWTAPRAAPEGPLTGPPPPSPLVAPAAPTAVRPRPAAPPPQVPPRLFEGAPTPEQLPGFSAGFADPGGHLDFAEEDSSPGQAASAMDPPSAWADDGSLGPASSPVLPASAPLPPPPPALRPPAPPPGVRPEYRAYREELPPNLPQVEPPPPRQVPPPRPRPERAPPAAPAATTASLTDDLVLGPPGRKS